MATDTLIDLDSCIGRRCDVARRARYRGDLPHRRALSFVGRRVVRRPAHARVLQRVPGLVQDLEAARSAETSACRCRPAR